MRRCRSPTAFSWARAPRNPYPEVAAGPGRARPRAPRPRIPGHSRRDQRAPPSGLRHGQCVDPAGERDRLGGHGGLLRQLRPARATRRHRRQWRVRRTHVRGGGAHWEPRWSGWMRPGARRSSPTPSCRPIRPLPSSRWCTPRLPPGCATTSQPLARDKGNALLLVDMVTSLGGIEVAVDDWGVDIAYSGTQKCLGVPPGLSPLTVSDARPGTHGGTPVELVPRPQPALTLRAGRREAARVYHHTAPVTMIAALHAGLGAILDEGTRRGPTPAMPSAGRLLQNGLEALGLKLFAEAGHRLPQLTTVEIPADLPDGMTRGRLSPDLVDPLRHRDRGGSRTVGGQGVADRLHGPYGAPSQCPGVARRIEGGARSMNAARAVRHPPLTAPRAARHAAPADRE